MNIAVVLVAMAGLWTCIQATSKLHRVVRAGSWCDMMADTQGWFICKDHIKPWCIAPVLHCNGKNDCIDGSDEQGCSKEAPSAKHRSESTMCPGCTSMQRQLLQLHNKLRAQEKAANMNELQWNPKVAARAQKWAEQCREPRFDESPHGMMDPDLGQNVGRTYWKGELTTEKFKHIVQLWYGEKGSYHYSTDKCTGAACGHYKAMVSAYARELGCGFHKCKRQQNGMKVEFNNMVCDYRPWPNWKVWKMSPQQPFIEGARCSKCQPGLKCRKNLCA